MFVKLFWSFIYIYYDIGKDLLVLSSSSSSSVEFLLKLLRLALISCHRTQF